MAIQFPDFGRINFSEANPYLAGAQAGQGIIGGQQDILSKLLAQQKMKAELPYAGLLSQANIASKVAFSKLSDLQPFLKLSNNAGAMANLSEEQKRNILDTLYSAGVKSSPNFGSLNPNISTILSGPRGNQSGNEQLPMVPPRDMSGLGNGPTDIPLGKREFQPVEPIVSELTKPKTYSENVSEAKGIEEEGKKSGGYRADEIKDLNDIVFNAQTKQTTLDDINNMISSPAMKEIRQLSLAGRHELSYYATQGTPAQQELVGRLYAQMGNVVKDSSRDFAGQFRKGEQQLLQGMKPGPGDTVDVMKGKAEALSTMNKILMERARLTSQYMSKKHINKLEASQIADKEINSEAIMKSVHHKLYPIPKAPKGFVTMEKDYRYFHIPKIETLKAKEAGYSDAK